jgi:hypothetical protein
MGNFKHRLLDHSLPRPPSSFPCHPFAPPASKHKHRAQLITTNCPQCPSPSSPPPPTLYIATPFPLLLRNLFSHFPQQPPFPWRRKPLRPPPVLNPATTTVAAAALSANHSSPPSPSFTSPTTAASEGLVALLRRRAAMGTVQGCAVRKNCPLTGRKNCPLAGRPPKHGKTKACKYQFTPLPVATAVGTLRSRHCPCPGAAPGFCVAVDVCCFLFLCLLVIRLSCPGIF